VEIPVIMPKPDLTALTGGYRKTPVLQIGADIYCDSQLIMRELERLHPSPSFYPAATARPTRLPGGPRRLRSARLRTSRSQRDPTRCPTDFSKTGPNSLAEISIPPR
jgi:Glutathione S-transferase, N-terminal domain